MKSMVNFSGLRVIVLLIQVHLMVAVVGRLFQKWFPAQPNLSYTFIWDKTDAYGQRVFGLSEAVGEQQIKHLTTFFRYFTNYFSTT